MVMKATLNKDRKRGIQLDSLNGVLVVNVNDGEVKFGSDMDDETVWASLAMALVSQSHKLGLGNISTRELLDIAWQRVEE